jgi:peptide chain release factor 2
MDWAEMLERMYMRWASDQGFSCTASDRSVGEEAGIKGVELAIRGKWAYGYLKGELAVAADAAVQTCLAVVGV